MDSSFRNTSLNTQQYYGIDRILENVIYKYKHTVYGL